MVEITTNTTLDGTIHNGAILVCSQPVTLTPAFANMGSGFTCSVVNVSGGNVTFGAGVITSSGTQTLPTGQAADLRAFSYTGGNVVFAAVAGGGAAAIPPGQVTGLAVGVTTPSSVALTWQAPGTGGTPTGYTVNYRVTSVGGAWTSQSAAGTSLTVTGLAAATQYDFEVIASNAAGSGAASSVVTGTTQAAPTQAPGQVTGLTASGPTASTVNLSWTAPSTGGAAASYTAQCRVTGGTGWNTAASGIAGTSYTVTGLAAATGYDFQVYRGKRGRQWHCVGGGDCHHHDCRTGTAHRPCGRHRDQHYHAVELDRAGRRRRDGQLFGALVAARREHLDRRGDYQRHVDHDHRPHCQHVIRLRGRGGERWRQQRLDCGDHRAHHKRRQLPADRGLPARSRFHVAGEHGRDRRQLKRQQRGE